MTLTPSSAVVPPVMLGPVNQAFFVQGGIGPYRLASWSPVPDGLLLRWIDQMNAVVLSGTITQQGSPAATFPYNVFVNFVLVDSQGDAVRGVYYVPVRPSQAAQ